MGIKRTISTMAFAAICLCNATAQIMTVERYANIPDEYNGVFLDHVKDYAGGVVKSAYGQYFGQITREAEIYGYGTFFTDHDGEAIGQFRNGNLIFGIKMNNEIAKVGSETEYIVYDLRSGDPISIVKNGVKYNPNSDFVRKYKFQSLTYKNGDKYVGETVYGKRDGYGTYHYKDGNYYYGRYVNNKRHGYGALFKTDNTIAIQFWEKELDE